MLSLGSNDKKYNSGHVSLRCIHAKPNRVPQVSNRETGKAVLI